MRAEAWIAGFEFAKVLPDRNCPADQAYIMWPFGDNIEEWPSLV